MARKPVINLKNPLPIILVGLLFIVGGYLLRNFLLTGNNLSNNKSTNSEYIKKEYQVNYVLDGDTIEIATGEKVRYQGIDAPEKNKAYGLSAMDLNKKLVSNKEITLEFIPGIYDFYKRRLGYVWVGEIFVNEELLKQGLAKVYNYKGEYGKYSNRLEKAQQWAKENHIGLWSGN